MMKHLVCLWVENDSFTYRLVYFDSGKFASIFEALLSPSNALVVDGFG